jgi:hypothetical protein
MCECILFSVDEEVDGYEGDNDNSSNEDDDNNDDYVGDNDDDEEVEFMNDEDFDDVEPDDDEEEMSMIIFTETQISLFCSIEGSNYTIDKSNV